MAVEARGAGSLDEPFDLARRCDPDRVRQDDLARSREPLGQRGDCGWIDPPFERASEGDADRHGRGPRRPGKDRRHSFYGFVQGRVRVSQVEALGRAEGEIHAVEPAGREALESLLVQHEADVLDTVAPLDSLDYFFGAGHLRHRVVTDEADRFDPRQARSREPVDELRAGLRRDDVLLVLEAVPRADLAECHAHFG